MPHIKDLAQLARHIAAHHGWDAARAFKAYTLDDADGATLSRTGLDLLKVFPTLDDPAPPLSAALAVSLEKRMPDAPVHVVTGALLVEGVPLLEAHSWVMVGPHVADIALFRLAYSASGPAELSRHVHRVFGEGKALYVDHWSRTKRTGLTYRPEAVLDAETLNARMAQAYRLIAAES